MTPRNRAARNAVDVIKPAMIQLRPLLKRRSVA